MRTWIGLLIVTLASASAATGRAEVLNGGASEAASVQARSRIVDRTLSCTVTGRGFPNTVRYVGVTAQPGRPATVRVYQQELNVGFATGAPSRRGRAGTVWLNRSRCTGAAPRLRLSGLGLEGGRAAFERAFVCDATASVLIRVRAVFTRPVRVVPDPRLPNHLVATGGIESAALAMATPRGAPLLLATANGSTGRTSIHVRRSRCWQQ